MKKNSYKSNKLHKVTFLVYVDKAHMENKDPIYTLDLDYAMDNVYDEEDEAIEAIIAQKHVAKQLYDDYKAKGYPNVCVNVQMNGVEKIA